MKQPCQKRVPCGILPSYVPMPSGSPRHIRPYMERRVTTLFRDELNSKCRNDIKIKEGEIIRDCQLTETYVSNK